MSKTKKKKKSTILTFMTHKRDGGFVMMFNDMLFSPAWLWLHPSARSIYIAMRTLYGKRNSFSVSYTCTYSWLEEKANVRRGSIKGYLEELEIAGFIVLDFIGGRNTPNQYSFSDAWAEITEENIPVLCRKKMSLKRERAAKNKVRTENLK